MVRPPVEDNICIRCKGARLLCGKSQCPILMKHSILKSTVPADLQKIKSSGVLFGASPPAVFVGHSGYPKVNVGPLLPIGDYATQKDTHMLDSPEEWFGKSIQEIVGFRSGMIRSNFSMGVRYQDNIEALMTKLNRSNRKLLEATQELTLASNSVDTEAKMTGIRVSMNYDNHSQPQGPSGRAKELKVIDNVKVVKAVDKVVSDTDLKAADAVMGYLYKSEDVSITSMQRLFSAGMLGVKKSRKLVPTRWTITAIDDIIGKNLAKSIQQYPEIDKYWTFYGDYLDNKFLVLLMPGPWSYEMNECWNPKSIWNQPVEGLGHAPKYAPVIVNDFELESGRKKYADNVTGAYYAARMEIESFLVKNRKQARAIVFREVAGGYIVPLGVWVIRETIKQTLSQGWYGVDAMVHETLESALSRLTDVFEIPRKYWTSASRLLKNLRTQRRLDHWLRMK